MTQTAGRQRRRRKYGRKRKISLQQRLRYGAETAFAYIIYGFFRLLPLRQASALGGWILEKIGPHMGVTRVARKNLDSAFPEKSAAEKTAIIKGMWNNLGRVIAEYPHLDKLWDRVEFVGVENLARVREEGRAAIFWGGHLANWECAAMAGRRDGIDVHVVYRKPNNPGVDGLLRRARARGGVAGHIAKGDDGAREILSVLRRKGVIGILIDQKLSEGIPVPFFGQEALTAPAVAAFAQRLDCAVYPLRVERLGGGGLRVTIYPPMPIPVPTDDREADMKVLMTAMNSLLEDWIREKPADWLWIHKRWG